MDVEAEDDWDLRDTVLSGAIDVRSSMRGYFSAIPEMCRSYGLDVLANAGGVFQTALWGLNIIGEHGEM